MKKLLLFCLFLFPVSALIAQTFNYTGPLVINDNTRNYGNFSVTGLPTAMDSTFGLCSVTVNLVHTYDGDLDIWVISPNNDSILLSNNEGGGGDNFTNCVFTMSATNGIQTGTSPFTGSWLPEYSINNLNNGTDPNGTWRFCVADEAPQDTGHVVSIDLTFCANPPADPPSFGGPCAFNNGAGCHCPDGSSDCDLLPDMIASGDIITNEHTEYGGFMTLSNATPNIGWGPMEIHGSNSCWCDTVPVPCSTSICPNGNPPTEQLTQRIYHKSGTTITYHDTLTPGTMSYHPSHGHIHVNNWAEFTLRTATTDPNATHWPILARGSKISFCLINLGDCTNDLGYCRDSLGNPITMAQIPNAPFGLVSGCGVDQGIYTGMLDIYDQNLAGMFIDLTGVCNGDYYIVSITDPDGNFVEQNDSNNWVAVPIHLTMQHDPIAPSFNITSVSGNTGTFSFNNSDVTSYEWIFGDGNIDSTNNPVMHNYQNPGTYTVTLIETNPCGTWTSTQVITIAGIGEIGNFASDMLSAAPNPASGTTTITYQVPEEGNVQLEILDLLGNRLMMLDEGNVGVGAHKKDVDFNALGLATGTYLFRLTTPSHYSTLRVVNMQ